MRTLLLLAALAIPTASLAENPSEPKGSVTLGVLVSPEGTATDIKILSSDVPPEYEQKAIAQVKAMHYKPTTKNGKAIPAKVLQVIRFGDKN